jgi:hypothetical protein
MLDRVWDDLILAVTTGEITNTTWVIIVVAVLIVLFAFLFRLGN